MDVRVKLKISSKGMARGDNGRKEMSFLALGEYRLAGGSKEAVKQESILIKELP